MYYVETLERNGKEKRFLSLVSNYSFGIYLYAEPLNYVILYLVFQININWFGTEMGAVIIYLLRIFLTPLLAIGITYFLRKFHLKYLS